MTAAYPTFTEPLEPFVKMCRSVSSCGASVGVGDISHVDRIYGVGDISHVEIL
jgi:hypothetical protein